MAIWNRFFGSAVSTTAGVAVGGAIQPTLDPITRELANLTWAIYKTMPIDPYFLAQGVAQGQIAHDAAQTMATHNGISEANFDHMVDIANVGPGASYAFEMWRRGIIGEPGFRRALRRAGIEDEWIDDLVAMRNVLLTPGELAQARQRGFIDQARQYDEAAKQGVTNDRAEVQFKSAGLPPPTERALSMWRRGIITEAEFKQTIVEGNEKLKYQDEEAALFHPLLTPGQIVNQRLRGWRDTAWMDARLAEHGFSAEQANDMFEGQGRPIAYRQVFIGERRGGTYNGSTAGIEPAYLKALQESNIRPEWYSLAWAIRHSLPSVFVMRALTQDGTWDQAKAESRLLMSGWIPEDAAEAAAKWSGGGKATADPLVKSATTQAITEIRSAFLIGQSDEATARDWLSRLGVLAATVDELLAIWNIMREIPQKGLTAAQIKKAAKSLPLQWPRARALDELQLLGLTADDAATLLDE